TRTPPDSQGRGLGNPHAGGFLGDCWRAPLGKHIGRARGSSRNIRHEQSVGHSLLKMPDHPCFAAGDRDCQRLACGRSELNDVVAVILRPVDHDPVLAARRSHAHLRRSFDQSSSASRVTADVFSPSLPVAHLFCSFSFLPTLAMLCYPPGRACPNLEPFDPFDCKEVAASLTFANVEGYADHVSRNRQTEFVRAGPKHLQFSDKLLLRYHRCTWGGR